MLELARMQFGGHTIIQSQHLPFDFSYRNLSNDTFPYSRKVFLLGKKAFIIHLTNRMESKPHHSDTHKAATANNTQQKQIICKI